MPKVNRKMGGFCSGNSALPFVNIGGMGCVKKSFSTPFAVLVWLSQFWNGIFISDDGFYIRVRNLCIFYFTALTAINDKNGKQFKQRTTCRYYLKSFRISSSAMSNAVFRLFCMILNNSYSNTDFFFFFLWSF